MLVEQIKNIKKEGLVCYFVFKSGKTHAAKAPKQLAPYLKGIKKELFEGKSGQTFYTNIAGKKMHVLAIGLGEKSEFRTDNLRRAAGTAVRFAASLKEDELAIDLSSLGIGARHVAEVQAITEGAILAAYKSTEFKTKKDDIFEVKKVFLHADSDVMAAIKRGTTFAEAQNYSRFLDEKPANIATPSMVAAEAERLGKVCGFAVTIFDEADLLRKGMNSILSVGQGSEQPSVLIQLEYNRDKKSLPLYCIVGKGVTFDSGGISLKPGKGMHEMKYDKTGAMNVLGVFKAVSALQLPIRLLGLMPMVENMPSGGAQKPGDIWKSYNGKTIEVLNTDAEGRLILADTLAFAAEQKPKYMIDMATLTGAMVVALGRFAIGVFSTDDRLADALTEAGTETHERVWRMPLWPEHGEFMKSDIADLKNISEIDEAGSTTAAAFLKEFVGETKWAHLDIAAVDMVKPPHPYMEKGASGMGVRLVVRTLEKLASKGK